MTEDPTGAMRVAAFAVLLTFAVVLGLLIAGAWLAVPFLVERFG